MATSVSNLTLYFLQGAIEYFVNKVAPVTVMSYAINQEGAGLSDIVRVPFINAATSSNDFAYSTGYNTSTDTVTGKNITLNTLKYKKWDVTDQDILRMSPEVLRRLGGQVGAQLGSDVLNSIMLSVTASNFGAYSTVSASAFNTQTNMVALMTQADTAKWPDDRAIICNPTLYGTIVSNTTLVNYAYGSPEVVREGKLPKYFGFVPYVVTNLPTNSEGLQGFACHPDALLVGMAYHRPQDEIPYTAKQMVKDEKTGLVIGFRQWGDWTLAKVSRTLDCLVGSQVGNSNALIKIQTTPGQLSL